MGDNFHLLIKVIVLVLIYKILKDL